jgi:hypothetical protein
MGPLAPCRAGGVVVHLDPHAQALGQRRAQVELAFEGQVGGEVQHTVAVDQPGRAHAHRLGRGGPPQSVDDGGEHLDQGVGPRRRRQPHLVDDLSAFEGHTEALGTAQVDPEDGHRALDDCCSIALTSDDDCVAAGQRFGPKARPN